ncbi:heterokaryon incompatibility protein-domain-containing protein [Xylariaceae sp. FL0662B]|nr:heterokaryon incompatibility protein-domain-containing protein [Xylariaceae sp. FL0662B]
MGHSRSCCLSLRSPSDHESTSDEIGSNDSEIVIQRLRGRKRTCPRPRIEKHEGPQTIFQYLKEHRSLKPHENPLVIDHIPDAFTINPDLAVQSGSNELAQALCRCDSCQIWLADMCKQYSRPLFFVTKADRKSSFWFYQSLGIHWPENGISRSPSPTREESERVDSPWTVAVCIGRDEDDDFFSEFKTTAHVLVPHGFLRTIPRILIRNEIVGCPIPASASGHFLQVSIMETSFAMVTKPNTDDPSSRHFPSTASGIIAAIDSPDNWNMAQSYIYECLENHTRCRLRDKDSVQSGFRPTRLLDVRAGESIRLARSSETVKYIALSYCWGGEQTHRTLNENVAQREQVGFPLLEQPTTIRDAVKATRNLGYHYIWVDSLCIIQDNDDDMRHELYNMGETYAHAALLISATRANHADDGFLAPIDRKYIADEVGFSLPWKYTRQDGIRGCVVLESYEKPSFEVRTNLHNRIEPLHKRAWTMQEHLLS